MTAVPHAAQVRPLASSARNSAPDSSAGRRRGWLRVARYGRPAGTDRAEAPSLCAGVARRTAARRDVVAEPSGVAARDQGEGLSAHLRGGAGTPSSRAGTAGLTRTTDVTASIAASTEVVTSRSPTAISGPARHGEVGHRAGLSKGTAKAVQDSFHPRRAATASKPPPRQRRTEQRFTSRLAGPGERAPASPRHEFQGEMR